MSLTTLEVAVNSKRSELVVSTFLPIQSADCKTGFTFFLMEGCFV